MIIPVFLTLVVILQVLEPAQGDKRCRDVYKTIVSNHTGCLPPNHKCKIFKKGMDEHYHELIVKIHNDMRSKVATGNEKRGGKMPQASNMNEMTWDAELEDVAQKWAEHCAHERDCKKCRTVPRWSTGQNLYHLDYFCASVDACKKGGMDVSKPDWPKALSKFYDEVIDFEQKYLDNYEVVNEEPFEHFTQIVWADTLKIGCGFTVFEQAKGVVRQLYVCNYGPKGNVDMQPVYLRGPPCTACSLSNGCGEYKGLCRVTD